MNRMIFIANVRMPSEKAHGYQIVQMCEAFALNGQDVVLVLPRRVNTEQALQNVQDVWGYYGVRQNFRLQKLPSLDLIWLFGESRFAFLLQSVTFNISLVLWLFTQRSDKLFSRDPFVMAVLALFFPRHKLIYEVHHKFRSGRGLRLQAWILQRMGRVVSLTGTMAAQLETMGARNVVVAHDGIRPERFENLPTRAAIRQELGIPQNAFVACYAGRLHTMNMSKGLDVFVQAMARVGEMIFLLVGGPDEQIAEIRQQWNMCGLAPEHLITPGTVAPVDVPRYLIAADVCVITSPENEFFAHETSPMKLFEYMMAGRAILASDLPSTREVVTHGETAYLVPPSHVDALAEALQKLREDADLREKLAQNAQIAAQAYTWQARAEIILEEHTA